LIQEALAAEFEESLNEVLAPDRWIVLPPLDRAGMRRLVTLRLEALTELLPKGSPPIEIEEPAAAKLIDTALSSRSANKTVSLVDLIHALVEPPVDAALLAAGAPVPMRVRVTTEDGQLRTIAAPVGSN
jgi:ATP-dependent Clp protease ATP-binding subunit ClpA